MNIMLTLLDDMEDYCEEGIKLNRANWLVSAIDARTKLVLDSLGFNPDALPHTSLFKQTENERLQNIQEILEVTRVSRKAAIPYVVDAYCRSIRKDVSRNLLAFATDFTAGANLQFKISFSSFAYSFSSLEKDSEKRRIQGRLQEMKNEGFYIGSSEQKDSVLIDCDENRKLLRQYCKQMFSAEPYKISTYKNFIQDISLVVQWNEYTPILEDQKETKLPSGILTADGVIRLEKAISDAKNALQDYEVMEREGSGNLILSIFRNAIREIEDVTGIHGDIWKEIENEVADARKKNLQIRSIEAGIQESALPMLIPQMRFLFQKASENVNSLASSMGLFVDRFKLLEHHQLEMVLGISHLVFKEPSVKLNGYWADRSDFYIFNTQENVHAILATVRAVLPSAGLESYETKMYEDVQYISKICIQSTDPLDMMRLIKNES